MSKLSEMIENYMRIARKLSTEFDILLSKEFFSSIVISDLEIHLIVSLGGEELKTIPTKVRKLHSFQNLIVHLFERKIMVYAVYIN